MTDEYPKDKNGTTLQVGMKVMWNDSYLDKARAALEAKDAND